MVLGFILFWPLGLALLFYMIWRKDMFKTCKKSRHVHMGGSTGNSAFDAFMKERDAKTGAPAPQAE